MSGNFQKGIILALVTALVSGISIFINKFAVTAYNQPLVFTSIKNTGVAILIIGILVISGKWRQLKKLSFREFGILTLIGIIGGSIPFYLFFTGLSTIPAINGAIIHKSLVIWVGILAVPFLKEKLSQKNAVIVMLLFGANVFVGGFSGFQFSLGEGLILLATLFWSVETILAKKILPSVDPDLLTAARMGFGAIILLIMSAIFQPLALSKSLMLTSSQWFWLILTTISLFAYVTSWYRALKFARATTVTAILVASTIVTNILSAVFITHTITSLLIIQSALIITGIVVLVRMEAKANLNRFQNLTGPVV